MRPEVLLHLLLKLQSLLAVSTRSLALECDLQYRYADVSGVSSRNTHLLGSLWEEHFSDLVDYRRIYGHCSSNCCSENSLLSGSELKGQITSCTLKERHRL
jgi:hypothetical protein